MRPCTSSSARGAKVVVADIDVARAQTVVAEIAEAGFPGHAVAVGVDVSDFAEVEAMVQSAVDAFGRLDVIFNNAGIAGGRPLLEHVPERDYVPMIRVDQTASTTASSRRLASS